MGRKKSADAKRRVIAFRLDEETAWRLYRLAAVSGRTVSELVRVMILEGLPAMEKPWAVPAATIRTLDSN